MLTYLITVVAVKVTDLAQVLRLPATIFPGGEPSSSLVVAYIPTWGSHSLAVILTHILVLIFLEIVHFINDVYVHAYFCGLITLLTPVLTYSFRGGTVWGYTFYEALAYMVIIQKEVNFGARDHR